MRSHWRAVALFIACIIYLFIGAGVFSVLESHYEEVTKTDVNKTLDHFLEQYPNVDVHDLIAVVREISRADESGVDADELVEGTYNNRWDVVNSFYFCASVITTIGFGHLSPSTTAGKSVFTIYAFFGIPLMFWFLVESGMLMKVRILQVYQKIQNGLSHCIRANFLRRFLAGIILFLIAYIALIVIPASIISAIEKWPHTDAQYFCFVAITTIGFGDLIATESFELKNIWLDLLYKICTTVYYFFGMLVLTTVAFILQDRRSEIKSDSQQQMMMTTRNNGGQNHVANKIEDTNQNSLDLQHPSESLQVTVENNTVDNDDAAGPVGRYKRL